MFHFPLHIFVNEIKVCEIGTSCTRSQGSINCSLRMGFVKNRPKYQTMRDSEKTHVGKYTIPTLRFWVLNVSTAP